MSNWQTIKFEDLFYIPLRNGINRPSAVRGNGYKMINMGEIFLHDRLGDIGMELVELNQKEKNIYKINKYDLIFARQSIVAEGAGKCSIVIDVSEMTCFESHIIRVRLNKLLANALFYFYFFQSPMGKGLLFTIRQQGVQAGIRGSDLSKIKVPLPSLPTQDKIATLLSNYDKIIENNLKRIKLLEESAKLIYEEWFLRFRVGGKKLSIDKESNLPIGWKKKPITKFNSFKQDKNKIKDFDGEKKYYATADVIGTEILNEGEIINWDNKPSRAQIKPIKNSVWFARMSNSYKVLCFNNKNIDLQEVSVLSSGFAGFIAKNDLCLPFLYLTINSNFFHNLKDLYATGATQVSLNDDSMDFMKIVEPSLDLVEKFGKKTLPLIEEVSNLRNKNKLIKEAKDILLPRLMKGIIDIDNLRLSA